MQFAGGDFAHHIGRFHPRQHYVEGLAHGIKGIGRDRFVRNVLYAIGNSRDPSLAPHAQRLTQDADPTVADAAQWALARLV